jgi:hypothetical protein
VHGARSDNVSGSEMNITRDGLMLHRLERNSLLVLLILLWCASVFVMSKGTCNSPLCIFLTVFVFGTNVLFLIQGFTMFVRYFLKRTKLASKISIFFKNKAASMAGRRKSDRNTELEMSVKIDSNDMMSNPMVDDPNSPCDSGEVKSMEKAEVVVEMENIHIQTHSDKNGRKYQYNTLTGTSEWLKTTHNEEPGGCSVFTAVFTLRKSLPTGTRSSTVPGKINTLVVSTFILSR